MGKKIVIQDTADVIVTSLTTGKIVMNAEAQLAGITGSISEEDLRGGIGNKKLYKIRTDKAVDLSMRSALADVEYWAMTQGVEIEEGGKQVVTIAYKGEVVVDSVTPSSALEIVLDVPVADLTKVGKVTVEADGKQEEILSLYASLNDPTKVAVDLSGVAGTYADGQNVTVFYTKEVKGQRISIDATKYSTAYKVEMRTIAYDVETSEIYSDIYFVFPKTIPSGEFDVSLENGSVYTPEINFSVMNETGKDELGSITVVPR